MCCVCASLFLYDRLGYESLPKQLQMRAARRIDRTDVPPIQLLCIRILHTHTWSTNITHQLYRALKSLTVMTSPVPL